MAKDIDNSAAQPTFDFEEVQQTRSKPPTAETQRPQPRRRSSGKPSVASTPKPSAERGAPAPGPNGQVGVDRQLLVNIPQACKMLCLSRTTLYELMWRGELTAIHIGRSVRFAVAQLESFVTDRITHNS